MVEVHQLEGVTPDIVLPDAFNYIKIGEREINRLWMEQRLRQHVTLKMFCHK